MNKKYVKHSLIVLLLGISFASYSQIISTIAGDSAEGYSGDGGPATGAELYYPSGITFDSYGNLYFADRYNERIREVNTSGIITTIAGNGYNAGMATGGGYSGDGGPATAAEISFPFGVTADAYGNIYIADQYNDRVRKVNSSGIISTFAGNGYNASMFGTGAYSGDGGPATAAELDGPSGVTLDDSGNVYISDTYNNRIRVVNTSGIINTFAGNGAVVRGSGGYSGDGGPGTAAEFSEPFGVITDSSGNVYIADCENDCIRKVNSSGIISTIAGNAYNAGYGVGAYSGDGGPATAAEFDLPTDLAFDTSGNLYISDMANNRIRMVNTSGIINTFAGDSTWGYSGDGGPATAAELDGPAGVRFDASGNFYLADFQNNRIRKVGPGAITGTGTIFFKTDIVNIYPIPTTGYFTISGIYPGQTIELYNYLEQKVYTSTQPPPNGGGASFTCQINISLLPNGIYLIRVLNRNGSVVTEKKIVKTE